MSYPQGRAVSFVIFVVLIIEKIVLCSIHTRQPMDWRDNVKSDRDDPNVILDTIRKKLRSKKKCSLGCELYLCQELLTKLMAFALKHQIQLCVELSSGRIVIHASGFSVEMKDGFYNGKFPFSILRDLLKKGSDRVLILEEQVSVLS